MGSQVQAADSSDGDSRRHKLGSDYVDGVDLTLIRWMLSLSPAQRLRVLQQTVSSLQKLRNARPVR